MSRLILIVSMNNNRGQRGGGGGAKKGTDVALHSGMKFSEI